MSTRFRADAQKITHSNYHASASPVEMTLPSRTNFLLIENMDAANAIQVSFDGGSTYKTIGAGKSLSLDVDSLKSYFAQSASGADVECLYGSEA